MSRRPRPQPTSSSPVPLLIGVTVIGVALGLGFWSLSHDSMQLEPVAKPTAHSEGSASASDAATNAATSAVSPKELFADAIAGTLTLDALLDHVDHVVATLDDAADALPLREGGVSISRTLTDGTQVALALSPSDARTAPSRSELDTISVAITYPMDTSLPPPWDNVPCGHTVRLSVHRSPAVLSGFAEAIITPSSSAALIEELLARSPPGRARTGTRFEWSDADKLSTRAIHATLTPDTTLRAYEVDTNTRPAIPRPERVRALSTALFQRAEARLAAK